MALVIDKRPDNISFAGNPIIVKAHTTLSGKTFLRIIAEVSVIATNQNGAYVHSEKFSYNVASDGKAVFNVAETVQAAIAARTDVELEGGTIVQSAASATYSVVLKEVYLEDMTELTGDVNKTITELTAVMGGLSDYECAVHPSWDAATFIGDGAVLSRKPDNEVLYGNYPLIVPVAANITRVMQVSMLKLPSSEAPQKSFSTTVTAWTPSSVSVPVAQLEDGMYELKLTPSARNYTTKKFVRKDVHGRCARFLFLNGFGALESITALTQKIQGYTLSADHYTEGAGIGESITDVINMGGQPNQHIQLTSGLVDRAWADWFACEFLPSRKVWMLFGSEYLPVAIETDDSLKLYDESHPDLCEVKFSVRCAFKGSTSSVVK